MKATRVVAVLALLLAACVDDEQSAKRSAERTGRAMPSGTASPTPTAEDVPTWPLTGLPAPDGVADRPALVVKVDNSRAAEPQVGLSSADLVVEALVEGGLTRLAAIYHSTLPEQVVPVRSIRTTDIGIVLPTDGALVASGGAQRVLEMMDDAGVPVIGEGATGFSRDSGRSAPYNVAVDPDETLSEVPDLGPPEAPYLPWVEPDAAGLEGEAVTEAAVSFSGAHTAGFALADGSWTRQPTLAATGDEFAAANVLVLYVQIRDAGYTDPAGNFVPETVLEGSGEALLLAGGTAVETEWSKEDLSAPFELTGPAGEPLGVPAGRTWIELVPESGSVRTG